MLNVYDKAMGSNSQSTLWMLSILAFFLFIVMACMEVLRSRVLVVAFPLGLTRRWALPSTAATMRGELRSGTSSANGQALSDITQWRHFLTGPAVFAVFDAPMAPYLLGHLIHVSSNVWLDGNRCSSCLLYSSPNKSASLLLQGPTRRPIVWRRQTWASSTRALRNLEAVFAMGMQHELQRKWRLRQDEVLEAQEGASNIAATFSGIIKNTPNCSAIYGHCCRRLFGSRTRNLSWNDHCGLDTDWSSASTSGASSRRLVELHCI